MAGLRERGTFSSLWNQYPDISPERVPEFVKALEKDGIKAETQRVMNELYLKTFAKLVQTHCPLERIQPLKSVMESLISRNR
jgi:hypothetical protein